MDIPPVITEIIIQEPVVLAPVEDIKPVVITTPPAVMTVPTKKPRGDKPKGKTVQKTVVKSSAKPVAKPVASPKKYTGRKPSSKKI